MSKFLDPTSDIVFKRLFGNRAHKRICIDFLNNVLELQEGHLITDVEFLDPYNQPNAKDDRQSIVDVRCVDQAQKTYIIEVQARYQDFFPQCSQYYGSRVLSTQLNKNIDFDQLMPVIVVSVMDFVLFQRHDRYLSHHCLTDQFDGKRDLSLLEFHYIELPKFKKNENELTNDLERWVFFLSHASQYMDLPRKIAHGNESIIDAFDIVSIQNWSKAELELYEMHLDAVRCRRGELKTERRLGKEEGRAEGELEGKRTVARQMLARGLNATLVQKVTGLSKDEIKKLG